FDKQLYLRVKIDDKSYEHIPNFMLVTQNIHKVYNFNFEAVQNKINESVLQNNQEMLFNRYELQLISDYDNNRDKRVLSLAASINELLLEKEPNNMIEKINYWQIVARKKGLSSDDIKELKDIVQDSNYTEDVHLAAKVLINTRFKGEFSLEKDSLDSIREYPIYNLVNTID
ncbi:hypothetical protein D1190_15115, partial [Listeria monocytogenes]|nr:hypothetical protein [Listeria monocytogenes]MDB66108.1 hypothetical protein [Listeria monocytogenes]